MQSMVSVWVTSISKKDSWCDYWYWGQMEIVRKHSLQYFQTTEALMVRILVFEPQTTVSKKLSSNFWRMSQLVSLKGRQILVALLRKSFSSTKCSATQKAVLVKQVRYTFTADFWQISQKKYLPFCWVRSNVLIFSTMPSNSPISLPSSSTINSKLMDELVAKVILMGHDSKTLELFLLVKLQQEISWFLVILVWWETVGGRQFSLRHMTMCRLQSSRFFKGTVAVTYRSMSLVTEQVVQLFYPLSNSRNSGRFSVYARQASSLWYMMINFWVSPFLPVTIAVQVVFSLDRNVQVILLFVLFLSVQFTVILPSLIQRVTEPASCTISVVTFMVEGVEIKNTTYVSFYSMVNCCERSILRPILVSDVSVVVLTAVVLPVVLVVVLVVLLEGVMALRETLTPRVNSDSQMPQTLMQMVLASCYLFKVMELPTEKQRSELLVSKEGNSSFIDTIRQISPSMRVVKKVTDTTQSKLPTMNLKQRYSSSQMKSLDSAPSRRVLVQSLLLSVMVQSAVLFTASRAAIWKEQQYLKLVEVMLSLEHFLASYWKLIQQQSSLLFIVISISQKVALTELLERDQVVLSTQLSTEDPSSALLHLRTPSVICPFIISILMEYVRRVLLSFAVPFSGVTKSSKKQLQTSLAYSSLKSVISGKMLMKFFQSRPEKMTKLALQMDSTLMKIVPEQLYCFLTLSVMRQVEVDMDPSYWMGCKKLLSRAMLTQGLPLQTKNPIDMV